MEAEALPSAPISLGLEEGESGVNCIFKGSRWPEIAAVRS
jgi:hypothetical protein